jgi:hypothetical protein
MYSAARAVSFRVHEHFVHHLVATRRHVQEPEALVPDAPAIEAMIDAAFWASLRREEGYVPKVSLAFLPPDRVAHPLRFEEALPLAPAALSRLAPAVERPGIHLGVWAGTGG